MNNFKTGDRYYYYLLTGGTDNGEFSRKVYVNGKTTTLEGGGPSDYATLKPFSSAISGDIKMELPKRAALFVIVENDKNLQSQAIQFDPVPAKAVGDAEFSVSATANSGLPVQFASSNPNVAVLFQGKVRIIGAGTCSIFAIQDGNSVYNPATPVTQSLTVAKGNQDIAFSDLPAKRTGEPDFSPGAIASSGLPCTYSSSNLAVALIVNNLIQLKGAGTTTITAKQAGNVNYIAASDITRELVVTVPTGSQTVSLQEDFELFPNPASGFITVREAQVNGKVTIWNSTGSIVYMNPVPASEFTISATQIGRPGLYFIQINTRIRKFVLQ
jgi:hypothetical protein